MFALALLVLQLPWSLKNNLKWKRKVEEREKRPTPIASVITQKLQFSY